MSDLQRVLSAIEITKQATAKTNAYVQGLVNELSRNITLLQSVAPGNSDKSIRAMQAARDDLSNGMVNAQHAVRELTSLAAKLRAAGR